MRGDELLQLTDELRVSAQRELSVDPSLDGGKPNLLEALDRDPCERLVRKIGELRRARARAPPQQLCRLLRRSSCPDLSGTLRQPLEAMQIELIGGEAQDVTGGTRLDRRRAEDPPQLGDLALHLRDGRDGGSAVVEIIGEPLDRGRPGSPRAGGSRGWRAASARRAGSGRLRPPPRAALGGKTRARRGP